jgi:hypothetical protein
VHTAAAGARTPPVSVDVLTSAACLNLQVDVHEINTRPLAGDAQKVYELAKIRNRGHGNILDHSTISGEAGVLG